jgi:hypothetical protein
MAGMKSSVGLSGPKILKDSGLEYCSSWHKKSHWRGQLSEAQLSQQAQLGFQNGWLGKVHCACIECGPSLLPERTAEK